MAEQYITAYAVDPALVAATGAPVGEAILPGRHWHELAEAFRSWGLTALADLWSRPWPGTDADPWPFPMYAGPDHLVRIEAELADFDPDRILEDYDLLPGGDDDADEAHWLVSEKLPEWITAARAAGGGLYLLRDGAK